MTCYSIFTRYCWLIVFACVVSFHMAHAHHEESLDEETASLSIEPLASLLFHIEEERTLLEEEASNEKILFSEQEVCLLWEKVRSSLFRSSTLIDEELLASLEDAKQQYDSLKFLTRHKKTQSKKMLESISSILDSLWEKAIILEKKILRQPFTTPLQAFTQPDPNLENNPYIPTIAAKRMRRFLLPLDHPMRAVLDHMCLASRITANKETFENAGFQILAAGPRSFIHVARHPDMPNYLVKVYFDTVLKDKYNKPSWEWLTLRCVGAQKVREIIQAKNIQHFVVPNKWIYCLPSEPSPPIGPKYTRHFALLLVDDMDLVSEARNLFAWHTLITKKHLEELYTIVSRAKGSSYRPDNIAYTRSGKFAFIDTEYPSKGPDYRSIRKFLNPEMLDYWDRLVKRGEKTS